MIFPWLAGLLKPSKAPVTYLLLFLNVLVFLGTYQNFDKADAKLDTFLEDDSFLDTQGSAFAVMIGREPQNFSPALKSLAARATRADSTARRTLGGFALRNSSFMNRAQTFAFGGDEVAIGRWRMRLTEFQKIQDENPSYMWGLSEKHNTWLHWFTYQFAHAGIGHLFWNMLFLVIFGCFIETKLGGSFVALGYVGGGLAGAFAFSSLSGISYSPLVGASGAVSGLIGLVCVAWWRRERVRYLYFLLPNAEYMGVAMLPSWILGLVFLLPDLTHTLSSSKELGSVAYTAHLGGAGLGILMALAYKQGWLVNETVSENDGSQPKGKNDQSAPKIHSKTAGTPKNDHEDDRRAG